MSAKPSAEGVVDSLLTSSVPESDELARLAANIITEKLGQEVVVLEVGVWLAITDWFVIASGTSPRHVRVLADETEKELATLGRKPLREEGRTEGEWVLMDYGEIVIHLFSPTARQYYALDKLWGDALQLEVG